MTLLDDVHSVAGPLLPPTRQRGLALYTPPLPADCSSTVALSAPVLAPLQAQTLLRDTGDAYETTRLRLPRDRVKVDTSASATSLRPPVAEAILASTLLDDPHTVPALALRPALARSLAPAALVTITVTVTDPVAGPFARTIPYSDTPSTDIAFVSVTIMTDAVVTKVILASYPDAAFTRHDVPDPNKVVSPAVRSSRAQLVSPNDKDDAIVILLDAVVGTLNSVSSGKVCTVLTTDPVPKLHSEAKLQNTNCSWPVAHAVLVTAPAPIKEYWPAITPTRLLSLAVVPATVSTLALPLASV